MPENGRRNRCRPTNKMRRNHLMNLTTNFLDAVLPEEGTYCVVGIRSDGRIKQEFVHGVDAVAEKAQALVDQKINAYFALASFKEGSEKRTQENAQWMKSFWLDLDCGPNKPFPNQAEALEALEKFRAETRLPAPTVVNSGNGVHVYWLLTHYISSANWAPIARRLSVPVNTLDLKPTQQSPQTKHASCAYRRRSTSRTRMIRKKSTLLRTHFR